MRPWGQWPEKWARGPRGRGSPSPTASAPWKSPEYLLLPQPQHWLLGANSPAPRVTLPAPAPEDGHTQEAGQRWQGRGSGRCSELSLGAAGGSAGREEREGEHHIQRAPVGTRIMETEPSGRWVTPGVTSLSLNFLCHPKLYELYELTRKDICPA